MPKTIMQFVLLKELVLIAGVCLKKRENIFLVVVTWRNRSYLMIDWWLIVAFWFSWQSMNGDDECAYCLIGKQLEGRVDVTIIVVIKFLLSQSSTIIMFTSHGEMFDNNKPWEWVSTCIFEVSVSFIFFHFVSNPMNWLSFLACFEFWFHLNRLLMFLLLVNRLCFMFGCWM